MVLNNDTLRHEAVRTKTRAVFATARDSSDHLLDFKEKKFLLHSPDDSSTKGTLGCLVLLPTAKYMYKCNTARSLGVCNNAECYLLKVILHPEEPLDYDKNPALPPHRLKYMPKALDLYFPGACSFVCLAFHSPLSLQLMH